MELKILIAEDEPRLREVLCDYFLSKGDFPTAAPDGLTALDLASEKEFDGVLLDIMMPGLDGLSVCRTLRKRSDVPIIFLTALSDEEDKLLGYELVDGLMSNITTNLTQSELSGLMMQAPAMLGYEMVQSSIPLEGTYANAKIRGMAVLEVDFEANKEYIQKEIYGK